jgi:hypothetical protein
MPRTESFDAHSDAYDSWFDRHADLNESELAAIREMLPEGGEAAAASRGTARDDSRGNRPGRLHRDRGDQARRAPGPASLA